MAEREAISFCRICAGFCGMVVSRDDAGRISEIRADRSHPVSAGYACFKGLQAPAMHTGPGRLLKPLKRLEDGSFAQISYDQALDEIAATLEALVDRHGPDSIGMFRGTGGYNHAAAFQMQRDFMTALGSASFFSTLTIDQSAKMVTADRLGSWHAGRQGFHESDVMLVFGGNPIVSLALMGYENFNSTKATKAARARGMKFIVVDPRRTELAQHATLFLQPRPGEDCAIAAGMLRILLCEGWNDREFCQAHVEGLETLRSAVERFTADYVAERAGIAAADLYAATALFARDSKRGIAVTGTGPCMAPRSNLADHLVETLNVVCGRFLKNGERVPNPGILSAPRPFYAEVVPPTRQWERGPQSRIRGMGMIGGEKMSATLADEILMPGPGQLKALIVDGGNPASGVPDQRRTVAGLSALDCLVAIEPSMTNTARLAHYILPPELQYERLAISNMNIAYEAAICRQPFQQYTDRVSLPPQGAEVMDDALILWELAKRMDLRIVFDNVPLDMDTPPTHEGLLEILTRNARIPLAELKAYPHGKIFDLDIRVEQGRPDAGRFQVAPDDIVQELGELLEETRNPSTESNRYLYTLISRRMRDAMNSYGLDIEVIRRRHPFNPAYFHQEDLAQLGVSVGDVVEIEAEAGSIKAVAAADDSMRRGVISMSHCWGDLPDEESDPTVRGSSTSLLVSADRCYEKINAMPRLSAIPVNVRVLDATK